MAEVGNLLGLITDEETRKRLIAQMEQMFDAAEDEEKLIEQIGSPTKVAVALIRYADKKRGEASEQPEPVQAPESPVTEMMEESEANAEAPDEDVIPELAFEETPAPAPAEPAAAESEVAEILLPAEEPVVEAVEPVVEAAEPVVEAEEPVVEAVEPIVEAAEPVVEAAEPVVEVEEPVVEVEEPVVEAVEPVVEAAEPVVEVEEPFVEVEEPVVEAAEPVVEVEEPVVEVEEPFVEVGEPVVEAAEPVVEVVEPVVDEALARAVETGAAEAFVEVPADEMPAPAAESEPAPDEAPAEAPAELAEVFEEVEDDEDEIVETRMRTNGAKAFLYFLIPGLVPGLPVFLVLFVLSICFLAIGVAAIGLAVSVFMSAFIGFNVVADMLLLIGAGTSIFAIALVLMWFAIWFLTKVCFGWVRLMHRGGVRFSRKEVPVE